MKSQKSTVQKAPLILIGLSLLLASFGAGIGFGDGGRNWAFELPAIVSLGLLGVISSISAVIVTIAHLVKARGKNGASWLALAFSVFAGLLSLFVIFLSGAASASV